MNCAVASVGCKRAAEVRNQIESIRGARWGFTLVCFFLFVDIFIITFGLLMSEILKKESSFKVRGEIIDFEWNQVTEDIVVLSRVKSADSDEHYTRYEELLTKISPKEECEEWNLEYFTLGIRIDSFALNDSGDTVAFFLDGRVSIFSFEKGEFVAKLEGSKVARNFNINFGGGFVTNSQIYIEVHKYNDRYWVTWDWNNDVLKWQYLEVNLKYDHHPEGRNFECHKFVLHPSKKLLFGLADFDHGGYFLKLFYILNEREESLKYIYTDGLEQQTGWKCCPTFNQVGDKLAIIEEVEHEKYALRIYDIENFAKSIISIDLAIEEYAHQCSLSFTSGDKYVLVSQQKSLKIFETKNGHEVIGNVNVSGKMVGNNKDNRFCFKSEKGISVYSIIEKSFNKAIDSVSVVRSYVKSKKENVFKTLDVKTGIYAQGNVNNGLPWLVPVINVYHAFYNGSFDIRNREQISGDKLPLYVINKLHTWFNINQAKELQK